MTSTDTHQGKRITAIFREAIAVTGGPQSDAVLAVKNYVDGRYPGFPWQDDWFAQISGAKAGERARLNLHGFGGDEPRQPGEVQTIGTRELQTARTFIREVGGGDIGRARHTLGYLTSLGFEAGPQIAASIDAWQELLHTAHGNEEVAASLIAAAESRCILPPAEAAILRFPSRTAANASDLRRAA